MMFIMCRTPYLLTIFIDHWATGDEIDENFPQTKYTHYIWGTPCIIIGMWPLRSSNQDIFAGRQRKGS